MAKAGAVDRLTDSTKFTGSHKERFDETGKGKGKAGREYIPDTSGYVSAYKGQGTYESKVKEGEWEDEEDGAGSDPAACIIVY